MENSYYVKRKKLFWWATFFMGFFGVVYCVFWFQSRATAVPLSQLTWVDRPTFVVAYPVERNQQAGMLLIRVADGEQQFFPGEWKLNFIGSTHLYAYGTFPSEMTEYAGQQLFYIDATQITDLHMKDAPGVVTAVSENSEGTGLLISIEEGDNRVYCLAKIVQGAPPQCDQINLPERGLATWNPEVELEVIILKSTGQIYTYSLLDPGFKEVDSSQEADRFSSFKDLLESPPASAHPQPQTVRLFNWIFLATKTGWKYFRIPLFSEVIPLDDQGHGLVVDKQGIKLFDATTQQAAEILGTAELNRAQIIVP